MIVVIGVYPFASLVLSLILQTDNINFCVFFNSIKNSASFLLNCLMISIYAGNILECVFAFNSPAKIFVYIFLICSSSKLYFKFSIVGPTIDNLGSTILFVSIFSNSLSNSCS